LGDGSLFSALVAAGGGTSLRRRLKISQRQRLADHQHSDFLLGDEGSLLSLERSLIAIAAA
jgi:hypothetical protein